MRRTMWGKAGIALALVAGVGFLNADLLQAVESKQIVTLKLELPNGEEYMRGEADPVSNLVGNLTITNVSDKRKTEPIPVEVTHVERLTIEQELNYATDKSLIMADVEKLKELADKQVSKKTVQVPPDNPNSFGVAYTPPTLGPHDLVNVQILRMTESGEVEMTGEGENRRPVKIMRDMPIEYTSPTDNASTSYIDAGGQSPVYSLPIGKFFLMRAPGTYQMTVSLPGFKNPGEGDKPPIPVRSNPVQFRILPYKIVKQKLEYLQKQWPDYERGYPDMDFMFYELPTDQPFREIYYVQKIKHLRGDKWEWHRLCSVAPGTKAQIKQINSKKYAILSKHFGSTTGFYTLDFSTLDPTIVTRTLQGKPGRTWELSVEGLNATATPSDGGEAVIIQGTEEEIIADDAGADEAPADNGMVMEE